MTVLKLVASAKCRAGERAADSGGDCKSGTVSAQIPVAPSSAPGLRAGQFRPFRGTF